MRQLALVLGAGGQLGQAMAAQVAAYHEIAALTRAELDVTSGDQVASTIATIHPDIIINCAAYTHVDAAEQNPVAALAVNAWAARSLARAASEIDATLIHFSTDFVFDGVVDRPYTEDDAPNPQSTYASSKLLGEWLAAEAPRHYILRVESLFGGPQARSSVDRMLENLRTNGDIRAFVDRTVSPTFVDDAVAATMELLARDAPAGVYHCVNSGWTNWAELARELARLTGHSGARIQEIRMADAGLIAQRPRFAALSNAKLLNAGIEMPTWQDALARYVAQSDAHGSRF